MKTCNKKRGGCLENCVFKRRIWTNIIKVIVFVILNCVALTINYFYIDQYVAYSKNTLNCIVLVYDVTCFIYVNNKLRDFKKNNYLWKKLFGMREKDILKSWYEKNWIIYIFFVFGNICVGLSGNCVLKIIGIINVLLIFNMMVLFAYCTGFKRAYMSKIFCLVCIIWMAIMTINILGIVVKSQSIDDFLNKLSLSLPMMIFLFVFNNKTIAMSVVLFFINIVMMWELKRLDNSAYEEVDLKYFKMNFVKRPYKLAVFKSGFVSRNLSLFLVNKKTVYFIITYLGYFYLSWNLAYNESVFMVITIVGIIIVGGCVDFLFHADAENKMWYRSFGETYVAFLVKKLVVEFLIQLPILCLFLINSIIFNYDWITIAFLIIYSILYGVAWALFFSSYYLDMKKSYVKFEIIRIMIAMILIINPITCFFMNIYWYKRGERRWKKYVGY